GYVSVKSYLSSEKKALTPVMETKHSMAKQLPEAFKQKIVTASPSATYRVPILLYHYVENVKNKKDRLRVELNITPFVFEEQVKTLLNAGYTFMTAKELGDVLDGKMALPPKPILLTFDDGHWDFATDVLPILKKYNVKATAYIIPGFTGGSDFMSQEQVMEASESGLVDIGAHTVHHISLKAKPYEIVKSEIDDSKTMLENTYHIQVVSFAYPNGFFDEQAVQLTKEDGFTTAVSTVPGIEQNQTNRFFLYRLRAGARTGQTLLDWLQQDTFKAY
ncbi:MAG: polysaccharide deacetylase family protein, partial [Candidatus Levyibacteriota bacterium]